MFYPVLDCIATGTIIGVLGHVIFNDQWLPVIPALLLGIGGAVFSSLVAAMLGTSPEISSLAIGTIIFLLVIHGLCHQRLRSYARLLIRQKVKSLRSNDRVIS